MAYWLSVHFNWWHSPGTLPQCNINKATCYRWKESLTVWLQAVVCHLLLGTENWLWSILFTEKYCQTDPSRASLASEYPGCQLHWTHQELGCRYLKFSHFRFGNTISHLLLEFQHLSYLDEGELAASEQSFVYRKMFSLAQDMSQVHMHWWSSCLHLICPFIANFGHLSLRPRFFKKQQNMPREKVKRSQ